MSAYMIIDGQWGSCGKGLLAGALAVMKQPQVVVNNFGPNAGHTFYHTPGGRKILTQQLPTGLVAPNALLLIGPGSIINPDILLKEIEEYEDEFSIKERLFIHPRAAVVLPYDLETEKEGGLAISSTRKGVGSAISRKISRDYRSGRPLVARDVPELRHYVRSEGSYNSILADSDCTQIESAQGLELSINHGISYPYCTSRDITVEAVLNDVGIRHHDLDGVFTVVRTFPIRVGNDVSKDGIVLGVSGPVYSDMDELSWEEVGRRTQQELLERTTVTNKVRRVFSWSWQQYEFMLRRLGPNQQIFINFMNYLDAHATSFAELDSESKSFVEQADRAAEDWGSRVSALGFGPTMQDVYWMDQACV